MKQLLGELAVGILIFVMISIFLQDNRHMICPTSPLACELIDDADTVRSTMRIFR